MRNNITYKLDNLPKQNYEINFNIINLSIIFQFFYK